MTRDDSLHTRPSQHLFRSSSMHGAPTMLFSEWCVCVIVNVFACMLRLILLGHGQKKTCRQHTPTILQPHMQHFHRRCRPTTTHTKKCLREREHVALLVWVSRKYTNMYIYICIYIYNMCMCTRTLGVTQTHTHTSQGRPSNPHLLIHCTQPHHHHLHHPPNARTTICAYIHIYSICCMRCNICFDAPPVVNSMLDI